MQVSSCFIIGHKEGLGPCGQVGRGIAECLGLWLNWSLSKGSCQGRVRFYFSIRIKLFVCPIGRVQPPSLDYKEGGGIPCPCFHPLAPPTQGACVHLSVCSCFSGSSSCIGDLHPYLTSSCGLELLLPLFLCCGFTNLLLGKAC